MPKKKNGYFVVLPETILSSPAYQDLKPAPRSLLVELLRIYRPTRNGRINLTESKAKELLHVSEKIAARAFYELSEHGFIKLVKNQSWMNHQGREWAITFHPVNDREPTNEYLKWVKGENVQPTLNRPLYLRKKTPTLKSQITGRRKRDLYAS